MRAAETAVCVVVCSGVLKCEKARVNESCLLGVLQCACCIGCVAVCCSLCCCNVMQRVTLRCSVLQCVAERGFARTVSASE